MKKSNRPLLAAMLVMSLFALLGAATAHAQDENPLVATTGPNVLGQGKIQWNSQLEYMHYEWTSFGPLANDLTNNSLGVGTSLRFGVGSRAELTLDLAGNYSNLTGDSLRNTCWLTPSVGARLLLFDGRGWLPQVAFFTHVSVPVGQNAYSDKWDSYVQPEIGLQFRNRLGQRWLLDYSLGYS